MDIIAKSAPEIDPTNLRESLQTFRSYMVETLELIDFTLANQKNRISGAVSAENFQQLAAQVASLNSSVVNLTVLVSALSGLPSQVQELESDVSDLLNRMGTAETAISDLLNRMGTAETAISDLQDRVSALENPT